MRKIDFGSYLAAVLTAVTETVIEREGILHEKYKDTDGDPAYKADELYHEYLLSVGACEILTQINEVYAELQTETFVIPDESLN